MMKRTWMMAFLALVPCALWANERHFSYLQESSVMNGGERELELTTTFRNGRATAVNDYLYSEFDHRAEMEMGLGGNLQTSFYLNWKKVVSEDLDPTTGARLGSLTSETEFQGISSEWKYKLADNVADAVGAALYTELSLEANEAEIELKLILDKKMGDWLLAYNLVHEREYAFLPDQTTLDYTLENDLGLAYFFTNHFSAGLEVTNPMAFSAASSDAHHSALFLGPVATYVGSNWFVTATVLFQLPAFQRSVDDPTHALVLDELESLNARVILSWTL